MTRSYFADRGTHSLCHKFLGLRRNHLVFRCNHVPRRQMLPGWWSGFCDERVDAQRLPEKWNRVQNQLGRCPVTLPHFTSPIKWVSLISLRPYLDTRSARGHSQTEPIWGVCSPFAHTSLNFSLFQSSQFWHLGCFSPE